MGMIQSTTDDPIREGTEGLLESLRIFQNWSFVPGGMALIAGVIAVFASTLGAGERPHPSLVDPAITKCMVCHNSLGAAHPERVSSEDCLTCHTIFVRSKKTFLMVEESQAAADMDDLQVSKEIAVGDNERGKLDTPARPDTVAARSQAPSVEAVAVIAERQAIPSTTGPSPTSAPATEDPMIVGDDAASVEQLYAEGMAAFNRADFERAFGAWWLMLSSRPEYWVIQVEMDTYLVSAQTTLASYGEHSLYVIKKDGYHWVLSGLFATRAEAIEALELLPASLRKGGAFPIRIREIMTQQ